jgi:hypothetical protein
LWILETIASKKHPACSWSSCDYLKQLQAWRSTSLLLKLLRSSWRKRPQFLVSSHLYYYVGAPLCKI